jgi:hypothetical protein
MKKISKKYKKKVPKPLAAQFENRLGREDAIKRQANRKKLVTELFPAGTAFATFPSILVTVYSYVTC